MKKLFLFLLLGFLTVISPCFAAGERTIPWEFTCGKMVEGPVTLTLEPCPFLTERNIPQTLTYTLENSSSVNLECRLTLQGADSLGPVDESGQLMERKTEMVTIPAGKSTQGTFNWMAGNGTYSAFYPLRVTGEFEYEGTLKTVEAVRVIESRFKDPVKQFTTTVIHTGGVSLLGKSYQAEYEQNGEVHPLGNWFTGSDQDSSANINPGYPMVSGTTRYALILHPPYRPTGGALRLKYPVQLPNAKGIALRYAVAIRESVPPEPLSDGVTFSIIVTDATGQSTTVQEVHSDSKSWLNQTADLSPWSNQEVTITVQVHPGPDNNTTCDSCFISDLMIVTDSMLTWKDIQRQESTGEAPWESARVFDLGADRQVEVTPGPSGLLDAQYKIITPRGEITYNGMTVAVGRHPLTTDTTSLAKQPGKHGASLVEAFTLTTDTTCLAKQPETTWNENTKLLTSRYQVLVNDEIVPVILTAGVENGMFVITVPDENPVSICGLSWGPVSPEPRRIYFAHGYAVEGITKPHTIGFGGHELATSFVGFEFPDAPAILMASSIPPQFLELNPERKVYSLIASDRTKLAILPNDNGAFAAAKEYREHSGWVSKPGPGVRRKAGRLVFDIWGGSTEALQETLTKIFDYGVTDTLFIQHAWQRYGYDIRLPDIWDEEADYSALRNLAALCKAHDVPFALHDNYIDFYPDANGFTYDKICFTAEETPVMAWNNWWAKVLSYRWRPDLIFPSLEKNMELGQKLMPDMDAYFIDVFASIGPFDFYSRNGDFYPRSECQKNWKKCFEKVDQALSKTNAQGEVQSGISMSESGDDSLIGSLDGADAQWRSIAFPGRENTVYLPCTNWVRTPWFSMVNHTNYSRHGAGYDVRYRGNLPRDLHGIGSDDYLATEMLGGLDLMVDLYNMWPDSIRLHYLAGHVTKRLANQEMESVTFDTSEGTENLYHQTVLWSDGTRVQVNRGQTDWKTEQYTLPAYGYAVYDANDELLSGVVANPKEPGETIELAQNGKSFYLNGRGWKRTKVIPIVPELAGVEQIDDRHFKVAIKWEAFGPAPKDLSVFVHIFEPDDVGSKGWYAGGGKPEIPTSQWGQKTATSDTTQVLTSGDQILTIPDNLPEGHYRLLVGLFDSDGKWGRAEFPVTSDGSGRYQIAMLHIAPAETGYKVEVTPTPLVRSPGIEKEYDRLQANQTPASFHGVSCNGAVQCSPTANGLSLLVLPVMDTVTISLDETLLGTITEIHRGSPSGGSSKGDDSSIEWTREGHHVSFQAEPGPVAYEIQTKQP